MRIVWLACPIKWNNISLGNPLSRLPLRGHDGYNRFRRGVHLWAFAIMSSRSEWPLNIYWQLSKIHPCAAPWSFLIHCPRKKRRKLLPYSCKVRLECATGRPSSHGRSHETSPKCVSRAGTWPTNPIANDLPRQLRGHVSKRGVCSSRTCSILYSTPRHARLQ